MGSYWLSHVKPPLSHQWIDWGHPRLQGIAHWFLFREGGTQIYDLVTRQWFATTGSPTFDYGIYGAQLDFDNVDDEVDLSSVIQIDSTWYSMNVIAEVTPLMGYTTGFDYDILGDPTGGSSFLEMGYFASSTECWTLRWRTSGGATQRVTADPDFTSDAQLHRRRVVGWNLTAADGVEIIHEAGTIVTTSALASTAPLSFTALHLGSRGGGTNKFQGKMHQVRIYKNKWVTPDMCASVYAHPYLEFVQQRSLGFAAAVGGANAPTGALYGPLVGCLGGPI